MAKTSFIAILMPVIVFLISSPQVSAGPVPDVNCPAGFAIDCSVSPDIFSALYCPDHTLNTDVPYGNTETGSGSNTMTGTDGNTAAPDSTAMAAIRNKLEEYFAALERETADTKCREADFIIGICTDSLTRQAVTILTYSHFLNSPVMGDEAVAIHVFDRWISDGPVKMYSDADYFSARLFAETNRNSLIGCKAPALGLHSPDGIPTVIFGNGVENLSGDMTSDSTTFKVEPEDNPHPERAKNPDTGHQDRADAGHDSPVGNMPSDTAEARAEEDGNVCPGENSSTQSRQANRRAEPGLYSILYFYDTGCAKCKVESILLRNLLGDGRFHVNLFAIYTGTDAERWKGYREHDLDIDTPQVNVIHLWDPDMTSDMAVKYGVIRTPAIFLTAPDSTIAGRRLDVPALENLLDIKTGQKELEYGSDEAMRLFEKTFSNMKAAGKTDCNAVARVAEHIYGRTLTAKDTVLYRQMTGDLLYFLTNRREEKYKCGTAAFLDRYILTRPDIWNTSDDTLKVVSLARMLKGLDSLCTIGQKMADITVPATVRRRSGDGIVSRQGRVRLSRLKNTAVIFHTEGCLVCKAETEAADTLLLRKRRISALTGGCGFPDAPERTYLRTYGRLRQHTGTRDIPAPAGVRERKNGRSIRIRKTVLIDMDGIWNTSPALAEEIMRSFDLSSLPFILVTDSEARVYRKYVSLL